MSPSSALLRKPSAWLMLGAVLSLRVASASPIVESCLQHAESHFSIASSNVLRAIMETESATQCRQRHPANRDGSYDIGCMGINSRWLPLLQQRFHLSENDLYDRCTNIHVGAWIYARNIRRYGNTWQAIGAYNALSESKRAEYSWKIYQKLAQP